MVSLSPVQRSSRSTFTVKDPRPRSRHRYQSHIAPNSVAPETRLCKSVNFFWFQNQLPPIQPLSLLITFQMLLPRCWEEWGIKSSKGQWRSHVSRKGACALDLNMDLGNWGFLWYPEVWSQVGLRKHYYEQSHRGDRIPAELFKILNDDAVKELQSICQRIWQTQRWPRD